MLRVNNLDGFGNNFSTVGGGGTQTLEPSLLTNANTFYSPTLSGGAVALLPPLLASTSNIFDPTIVPDLSSFVVLILNPTGADGSSTFTDTSPAAHGNADKNGSPEVDTAITFGGAPTLYMPGNAAIGWPDASNLDIGRPSGTKWCVEAAVRFISTSANQFIVAKYEAFGDSTFALSKDASQNLVLTYSTNASSFPTVSFAWSPSTSTWYEVAANYDGDKIRLFIDGTCVATSSSLGAIALFDSSKRLAVGCNSALNANLLNGSIGRVRVTNGSDRAYGAGGYTVKAAGPY